MSTKTAVPFAALSHFSRTWHAVTDGRVPEGLYARMPASVAGCREAMTAQLKCDRPWKRLAELLRARGEMYGVPPQTLARLDSLAEGRAVMVVTGQQVGYLGGPLYTFLKAYHTTRLAAQLETELGVPVLPLFWLEGEDHDLEEVRSAHFPSKTVELETLRFEPPVEQAGFMVGHYAVDAREDVATLEGAMAQPDLNALRVLEEAYAGGTLSDAMGKLLSRLLGERGLLVVEGGETELKMLAQPLWEKVLERGPALGERLRARSEELKAEGWATPLEPTPDSYPFYLEGPGHVRQALGYDGTLHLPGGGAEKLSADEIRRRVMAGEISPKAALRPLFQDTVLPTVAYVAGPGELDYHAQLAPLYGDLGVVAPSLYPRLSATLLDGKTARVVEKLGIALGLLLGEEKQVLMKELVREQDELNTAQFFDSTRAAIEALYGALGATLAKVDPTLKGAAHGAAGKSLHPLDELRQKCERALKQNHATELARLEKTLVMVKPGGKLSERVYSTGYYLARFGAERLLAVVDELPVDGKEHWVVEAEENAEMLKY